MANISIYDPRTMGKLVERMPKVQTFIKSTFFRNVETFDTQKIDVDFKKGNRQLAPFVHKKIGGVTIDNEGYESPQDGVADIRIMLYGGELPSEELIKEVQAYLSADDIRPMTDKVTVAAPTTVDFDIELTYYIPKDKEASTKEIKRAVDLAVESYELWQTSKMGRDINPSYFYAILMDSGIKRADIKKPVFTEIPKGSVAVLKKCTVTFGGVEDE